jgi:hypothetical protein
VHRPISELGLESYLCIGKPLESGFRNHIDSLHGSFVLSVGSAWPRLRDVAIGLRFHLEECRQSSITFPLITMRPSELFIPGDRSKLVKVTVRTQTLYFVILNPYSISAL